MNKQDLIAQVAERTKMQKPEVTQAVDAVLETIITAMKAGEEVRLTGFGTFLVSTRAASEGRNPRTGEKIAIPATKQPKFRAGTELKRMVNG